MGYLYTLFLVHSAPYPAIACTVVDRVYRYSLLPGISCDALGGAMNLCGVLFVVFLVLKLVGVIAWSWFWVLSPLLIPVLLALITLFLVLLAWAGIWFKKLMD